jgi:hypothetical protein
MNLHWSQDHSYINVECTECKNTVPLLAHMLLAPKVIHLLCMAYSTQKKNNSSPLLFNAKIELQFRPPAAKRGDPPSSRMIADGYSAGTDAATQDFCIWKRPDSPVLWWLRVPPLASTRNFWEPKIATGTEHVPAKHVRYLWSKFPWHK